MPSEGVAALVLEPAGRRAERAYAQFSSGRWASGGRAAGPFRRSWRLCFPFSLFVQWRALYSKFNPSWTEIRSRVQRLYPSAVADGSCGCSWLFPLGPSSGQPATPGDMLSCWEHPVRVVLRRFCWSYLEHECANRSRDVRRSARQ